MPCAVVIRLVLRSRHRHGHLLRRLPCNVLRIQSSSWAPLLGTGEGALRQLHAFDGYGQDQAPCSVKPYVPELLSLPSCGSVAVPLESLIGESGGAVVGDFIHSRLLHEDEAR